MLPNCDAGAYESDGQFVPVGDVIFADNYAEPSCSDSDTSGPDFEAGALDIGRTNDCSSGARLTAEGLLGDQADVDFLRFTIEDEFSCMSPPTLTITIDREARSCVYYACDSGPADVSCRTGTEAATSSLGLPGCCGTGRGLNSAAQIVSCPSISADREIVIELSQPVGNCAAYAVEVD